MKLEHSKHHRPDMGNCVCRTVDELIPLYRGENVDAPDSLPGTHPDTTRVIDALRRLIDVMLPGRISEGTINPSELGVFLMKQVGDAWRLLRPEIEKAIPYRWIGEARKGANAEDVSASEESFKVLQEFFNRMPDIRNLVVDDIRAAYNGDPAALSYAEVLLAYPGLLAIAAHRIAHELYLLDVPIIPRIMSEWTHARSGVDIHPGASIGRGLFIDHATGVVIGETAKIGNDVKIYQGVTLGAKSFPIDENVHPIKQIKRHPTVQDKVIIYANSIILGDIEIGSNSTIGGNVFLMEDVPPNSFVAAKHPELRIKTSNGNAGD